MQQDYTKFVFADTLVMLGKTVAIYAVTVGSWWLWQWLE
jgi:hypothetical protein